jgi:hypothetical protein
VLLSQFFAGLLCQWQTGKYIISDISGRLLGSTAFLAGWCVCVCVLVLVLVFIDRVHQCCFPSDELLLLLFFFL